jgi:hypothetical protein
MGGQFVGRRIKGGDMKEDAAGLPNKGLWRHDYVYVLE